MAEGRPDALADFTTDRRVVTLTLMTTAIGALGALVAATLVRLERGGGRS
jgi:hypothetical protein